MLFVLDYCFIPLVVVLAPHDCVFHMPLFGLVQNASKQHVHGKVHILNTGLFYFAKRNKTKWNLYFAKWISVLWEVRNCTLRNKNSYSVISWKTFVKKLLRTFYLPAIMTVAHVFHFCSWMSNIHELSREWNGSRPSILINLFIKVGLNIFSLISPAKNRFCLKNFSACSVSVRLVYGGTRKVLSSKHSVTRHGGRRMFLLDL